MHQRLSLYIEPATLGMLNTLFTLFKKSMPTLLIQKLPYSDRRRAETNLCTAYEERIAKQIIMHG